MHITPRGAAGFVAALAIATGTAVASATVGPADPYVDKYGAEICQALDRNPTHEEILKEIAAVRDYDQLSTEDAEIVVVDSVWRFCPQYVNLIEPPGSNQPPPRPFGE
ncbi:MAG: DUF732 domain-containing protein [Mycobacterium sp.]